MMHALTPVVLIACAFACGAQAQRADCPPRNVPMPTSPPGPPPDFVPKIDFPKTWDENAGAPRPSGIEIPPPSPNMKAQIARQKANDWLMDVEDGHVAALPVLASSVKRETPAGAARVQVDTAKTPLATWEFLGYARQGSANRVSRLYRRADGSLVNLEEWNFAADGGSVMRMPGMSNAKVGGYEATIGGMRGRSGCIESSLSWFDKRKNFSLRIAGPLALAEQRAVLTEVAESVARLEIPAR